MVRNTATDDVATRGKDETFEALKERFEADEDNVEVSKDELVAMGVATKPNHGVRDFQLDRDTVMVSSTKDIDPVSYELIRVGEGQWMSLTHLYNLKESGDKYSVQGIGDIQVEARPLAEDFGDDLDLSESQISHFREEFETCSEVNFGYLENAWCAAFDGSTVYMSFETTWEGWERTAVTDFGLDEETWRDAVKPAITEARPSRPHILVTNMNTEYAVTVSFE